MITADQIRDYWDEHATAIQVDGMEWSSREFFRTVKKFHDGILEVQACGGKSVLEMGCGLGIDALELAKHGARVTAIDLAPTYIEMAKRNFAYNNVRAVLEVGNAEQLRFESNSFDLVFAIGVFQYTQHPQKAINEALRILKPGGEAIVMMYNKYSWFPFFAKISGMNYENQDKDPPIVHICSVSQIRRWFAGFSEVNIMIDRFPTTVEGRTGILVWLYNFILVPGFQIIPKSLIRPFGFHVIVKAIK